MKLTTDQLDTLTELINIGVGQAAGMLNEMIEFRIKLQVPWLKVLSSPELLKQELEGRLGNEQLSSVQLEFSGSFGGNTQLVFPTESAITLVEVLTGGESASPAMDELKVGTLTELGNIVINGIMGSISNILSQPIHYDVPSYIEDNIEHLLPLADPKDDSYGEFLLAQTHFDISELKVQGDIILFFKMGSFNALLAAIDDVG